MRVHIKQIDIIFFIILYSNFSKCLLITKSALAIQYFYVSNFASTVRVNKLISHAEMRR